MFVPANTVREGSIIPATLLIKLGTIPEDQAINTIRADWFCPHESLVGPEIDLRTGVIREDGKKPRRVFSTFVLIQHSLELMGRTKV